MAQDCKTLKILDAQAYSIYQNIRIWNTVISILKLFSDSHMQPRLRTINMNIVSNFKVLTGLLCILLQGMF